MNGLSSLERIILEVLGNRTLGFHQIIEESGLQENICFNILQALIIRGIVSTNGTQYLINICLPNEITQMLHDEEVRKFETFELIEAIIEKSNPHFRIQRIAMDEKDEKIFLALISNLESFLKDAHKKSHHNTPLKSRKVIFWGMDNMASIINQLTTR